MPQLDATSFPSQLFWLMVSFVLLYVVLARFLLPRVQSVLAERAHTIESDISQAEQLRAQAARAEEEYEKALSDARSRSHAMFLAAQAENAERSAKQQAELERASEQKLGQSQASIRAAKEAVAGKLTPVASELAALIVEMLVHQKPGGDAVRAAVAGVRKGEAL